MDQSGVSELGPTQRQQLAAELPDIPVNTIPIGALRIGAATAYRCGDASLVILFGEGTAFGSVDAILQTLRSIKGCTCVLLPISDADSLGKMLTGPVKFLDDIQYVLDREPQAFSSPSVNLVRGSSIPANHRVELFGEVRPELLDEGLVACAQVDGMIAAQANSLFRSDTYGDIGVKTLAPYRGRGLATAASFVIASALWAKGLKPVWSTSTDNLPSRRVAAKLGFVQVSRQRFVVPEKGRWD